jgi:hypothetical protein
MFGYKCCECGKGIVKKTTIKDFKTKFYSAPFIVPEALIGICDKCGAEHFDAVEYGKWAQEFEATDTGSLLASASNRISELERALKPFADIWREYDEYEGEEKLYGRSSSAGSNSITNKDIRNAKKVLDK